MPLFLDCSLEVTQLPKGFQHIASDINVEFFTIKDHVIPESGLFLDVGAHFGFWSLYVAMHGHQVHAFEPSPFTFPHLKGRCHKHYQDLITCHNVALGAVMAKANLALHEHSGLDSLFCVNTDEFTGKGVAVDVRTLDSFKFEDIGVIKIDVEAYELQVIEGAHKTLFSQHPHLVIEVHEPTIKVAQVKKALKTLKYRNFKTLYKDFNNMPFLVASG